VVWLPAFIVIGVLLIRVGLSELKRPGSIRQQWRFLTNGFAACAGTSAFLVTAAAAWFFGSVGMVVWAVPVGLLVAFFVDRWMRRP
jgi:hypothetical protein